MGLTADEIAGRQAAHWIGPACAVLGVLCFSFKGILVKLAFASHPVDAVTILTLRMIYSVPFFCAMAWWASRAPRVMPMSRSDAWRLVWFGFIGYYVASLLDFTGLQYITASLERLVMYLYPTIVVLLSALLLGKRITRRAVAALVLSYAGIALVFSHDLRFAGDAQAVLKGGGLVFTSAVLYALYLVQAGPVLERLSSLRFVSWAMLASAVFVFAQFALTRPVSTLDVPAKIHWIMLTMAVVSTVLPVWLITESVRRMGANSASLIGALGPVFTIGFGAMILGENIEGLQIIGSILVLSGVLLVTLKRRPAPAIAATEA